MYPIIFSLIVNLPAIMTHVVASVFFFGVITFVTVCTEVDATQERSHAGNTVQRTVRSGPLCTTEYNTRQPS
jgi:hypothetical protein